MISAQELEQRNNSHNWGKKQKEKEVVGQCHVKSTDSANTIKCIETKWGYNAFSNNKRN